MKKGISPILSHSIFVAIGVVLLIFVSVMVWYIYTESVKQTIKSELKRVNQIVAESVIKLYTLFKDSDLKPESKTVLGSLKLEVPEKVGGRSYKLSLIPPENITVRVSIKIENQTQRIIEETVPSVLSWTTSPEVNVSYPIYSIEIELSGTVDSLNQPWILKYNRRKENSTFIDSITIE